MNRREYDQAILSFDKAIKIKPKFALAYCNRGVSYYEKGQYEQALQDFTKSLGFNPELVDAYYNRVEVYYKIQEYDKAWEDVYKARNLGYQTLSDFLESLRAVSKGKE